MLRHMGLNWLLFMTSPLPQRYETYDSIIQVGEQIQVEAIANLLISWSSYEYLIHRQIDEICDH